MLRTLEDFLVKFSIKNKNIIIAFSGGPDSVALAYLMSNLSAKYNLHLILCYFNHGWRKEALNEEIFTENFAKNINAEFYIGRAPKNCKKNEETARNLRYDFLKKSAEKFNTDVVLLAHNKNDNVETLVYRLIKGTALSGLTSIPPHRDIYYRPLLNVSKEDILEFIKEKKLKYMVDSSNDDTVHFRNLIRKEIFPLFSKINPNYLNNISFLIENAVLSRKIIDFAIQDKLKTVMAGDKINREKYLALETEYRYEILNCFLFDKLKNRDRKTILKLDNFIFKKTNSKTSINSDCFLAVNGGYVYLTEKKQVFDNASVAINNEGEYYFKNIKFSIKKIKNPNTFPQSTDKKCFLNIDFPLELRCRRNGDLFSPLGLKGKMKLKDYFINEKIPQFKKDELIMLAHGNDICWILGNRLSENCKVRASECYLAEYEEIN